MCSSHLVFDIGFSVSRIYQRIKNLTERVMNIENALKDRHRHQLLSGVLIVSGIAILITIYAAILNHLFYQNYAPFFDSCGYMTVLFRTMQAAKEQDVLNALNIALNGSTFTLPFLLGIPAGFFLTPTREIVPFLQLPWLGALAISQFYYFYHFRG